MKYNKKLNRSGGITLPAALRREYGLEDGEAFSIFVNNEDGTIHLLRSQGQCLFCKSEQQVFIYMGRFVCTSCVQNMDAEATERQGTT